MQPLLPNQQQFISTLPLHLLHTSSEDDVPIAKAGIIPFVCSDVNTPLRYYVLKPVPKRPDLGDPGYQLCKGTRLLYHNDSWKDMHEFKPVPENAVQEPLIETAIREGIEELGIELENLAALYQLGLFSFVSEKTGRTKKVWLYACNIEEKKQFQPLEDVQEYTQDRKWCTLKEFATIGRPDHVTMLVHIDAMLRKHLKAKG